MRRRSNRLMGLTTLPTFPDLTFDLETLTDPAKPPKYYLTVRTTDGRVVGETTTDRKGCKGDYLPMRSSWISESYRGRGLYPAMLSIIRDKAKAAGCRGIQSHDAETNTLSDDAVASWTKFAAREPRVKSIPGFRMFYLDGLAANDPPGSPDPKPKKQKKKAQRCAYCGTIVRNADYLDMAEALCRKCERELNRDSDFDGLAANGQRGSQALPLATLALVGIGAFIVWKILRSGETETYGKEAVGTGPCNNIDGQNATPIGCGTVDATGYVKGVGSPIKLSEIPGAPGYYLQSAPVNVWAAFLRLRDAAQRAGHTVNVNSAFRTMARQSKLYADYLAGIGNKAAKPGYSTHQNGLSVDIAVRDGSLLTWLRANAGPYGFAETVVGENWHWEYSSSRDRYARNA